MSALVINGWTIYAHPLFLEQLNALSSKVKRLQQKDPLGYLGKPSTKRLAAIIKLATHDIPQDPTSSRYRQGNTLGTEHSHWCRAKFYQQYRLFFRYDLASKILIYAWVNDESNKRAYDSKQDAYTVFQKMLNNGRPPDNWNDLWEAATGDENAIASLMGNNDSD